MSDPAASDPGAGDPAVGEPAADDPAVGGPAAGEPATGGSLPPPPVRGSAVAVAPAGTVISSRARRFGSFLLGFLLVVVTLGIGYLVWTVIVWNRGQNPPKQLLGMYVIDVETGLPATWGKMFLRGFVIDQVLGSITGGLFNLISAVWIFSNPENQRLTDKMMSTIVVDDPAAILRSRLASAAA